MKPFVIPKGMIEKFDPQPAYHTKEVIRGNKVKTRIVANRSLQRIHDFFTDVLQKLELQFQYATAWEKGSSPKKNILRHVNREGYIRNYIYKTDLVDAYKYVDAVTLGKIFHAITKDFLGYSELRFRLYFLQYFFCPEKKEERAKMLPGEQGDLFSGLLENSGKDLDDIWYSHQGLAEGFSPSPKLFNVYADWVLDYPIGEFCNWKNITYTRFGDDLIFSSDTPIGRRCRADLLRFIRNAGFEVSDRKTKYFDLSQEKFHQGIVLNGLLVRNGFEGVEISVGREFRKKLEGILHLALKEKNISTNRIGGLFGHFRTSFHKWLPNKQEKKIFRLMREFQAMRKREIIIPGSYYYEEREGMRKKHQTLKETKIIPKKFVS